ncbi:xin actin-binding repeat-containing protein 1-like isoform X2 [Hippocampus comes]|nr:PREDICTED: xin actin-binding repeat-containing protein 1-like isoform X2 [Hippocampus comes]
MKMAEDTQLMREERLRQGADNLESQSQQSLQFQMSKERLYQQRQKCELRRLLKHTHPELKILDEVVDEELAEVLSSDTEVTADETGYEGEVRSRCLIFENCSQSAKVSVHSPKMHTAVQQGNVSKISAVSEHPDKMSFQDQTVPSKTDPGIEREEGVKRIDVQATRRIFESQLVDTPELSPEKVEGKVSTPGVLTDLANAWWREKCDGQNVQCQEKPSQMNRIEQQKQGPDDAGYSTWKEEDALSSSEDKQHQDRIKSRTCLLQNNPFISKNIEDSTAHMTKAKITAEDDYAAAKVKDRAHLFDSIPFDQIRHQNKDEVETIAETLEESLNTLHRFNAIHADGLIIEVNESARAKKAKYTQSANGAKIHYDEVSEGNFQNFILGALPRANLKPQITYLTEVCNGGIKSTLVNVPVHPHQFAGSQNMPRNTANVVQLVEDVLNQDNSLRKGVIIQEAAEKSADVVVYSLYKYSDGEDVQRYCPREYSIRTDGRKSPLMSPDGACRGSVSPEVTMKGNVRLLKSCIEKGELDYLKTLQENREQEITPEWKMGQCIDIVPEQKVDRVNECTPEWTPVDIKRLRNMFSGDQIQNQSDQIVNKDQPRSITTPKSFTGQNVTLDNVQGSPVNDFDVHTDGHDADCGSQVHEETMDSITLVPFETQCGNQVVQAELIQVVNDDDDISNLQLAVDSLQEATSEAQFLHELLPEKHESKTVQHTEQPVISAPDVNSQAVHHQPKTSPQNSGRSEEMSGRISSAPDTEQEMKCLDQIVSGESHTAPSSKNENRTEEVQVNHFQAAVVFPDVSETQKDGEDVVFRGQFKAALDSLERSHINVTRGDFKAAMIYRNSSKPLKERVKNPAQVSRDKAINQDVCAKASQTRMSPNTVTEEGTSTVHQKSTSPALQSSRRPVGPKPAIPPKPEHLEVKLQNKQSTNTENSFKILKDTRSPDIDKQTQEMSKINTATESEHDVLSHRRLGEGSQKTQKRPEKHQIHQSHIAVEKFDQDQGGEKKDTVQETVAPDLLVEEKMTETEVQINFNETCKNFWGMDDLPKKRPPVKPKRVKIAQPDNISAQVVAEPKSPLLSHSGSDTREQNDAEQEEGMKQEGKVELRAKRGRTETDNERRQRLSLHMDEIMRGNSGTAMEIFNHLRKQEELRGILCRVEAIEEDTSEVDVRSLRNVFENVPDWVVSSNKKKPKQGKADRKEEMTTLATETKSPMAHVFGDLERASEEIMTLKEQTLARLVDIEEAIKKALYSVSTLKSESDIAGLSCLFKESLGGGRVSPASGNISKISIGSSKMASLQVKEGPADSPGGQNPSAEITPKHREGPPSSPAFISIQSAAKKSDQPKLLPQVVTTCPTCQHSPEKFPSNNSPAFSEKEPTACFPQRETSVVDGQTDLGGSGILGTKTIAENYQRTDARSNGIYSSTTSTVVTTIQPETRMSSTDLIVTRPTLHRVATYPEVLLPVNRTL